MAKSWSKKQIINKAWSELGISYIFDITPDMMNDALLSLDTMIAQWYSQGIALGYPLSNDTESMSMDEPSGLSIQVVSAVYYNLACRLAPTIGKSIPPATSSAAKKGYSDVCDLVLSQTPTKQFPNTMPKGAGNAPFNSGYIYGNDFYTDQVVPITMTDGGPAIGIPTNQLNNDK